MLRELASILGLFRQPPQDASGGDRTLVAQLVGLLVEVRAAARSNKDFTTADRIRDRLSQLGIVLEDRPNGTDWSWD
ncbi:MAG: hypothetical protein A2W31_01640 [Planctomycetes bacterium RBG_16_64_10]|nr:MAG: hypothetical protein A2W31_01640 [Planctomycetes bacterium RBG_16_64_10]